MTSIYDARLIAFLAANYALALIMWLCIGRFALFFLIARQPDNYIWRSFVYLTNWPVRATAFITPSVISPLLLPLIAAVWIYYLRLALFTAAHVSGFLPPLQAGG